MPKLTVTVPPKGPSIVGKKIQSTDADGGRPITFRASARLANRLDVVADKLGLDVSNLVRMILNENLAAYERRAQQLDQESV